MVSTQVKPKVDPVAKIIVNLGKYNLLPQLQREVIIDNAISSIKCTSEEIEAAYNQIIKTSKDTQGISASCQQSQKAKQQVIATVTRQLKIEKFKQATWGSEVPSYFISQKKKLDKVIYSEIVHKDEGVATEIYFRLLAREQSFTELGFEYLQSQDTNVYRVYDPIRSCPLDSKMAQILIKYQPGEVLRPIHCRDAYRVMRLEQILPAVLDESMHKQLLDELFEAWLAQGCNDSRYRKMMLQKLSSWTV